MTEHRDFTKADIASTHIAAEQTAEPMPAVAREEPPALPIRILGLLIGIVLGAVLGFVFGFIQAFFVTPLFLSMGFGANDDAALFEGVLRWGVYILTPLFALIGGWIGWRVRGAGNAVLTMLGGMVLSLWLAIVGIFHDPEVESYGDSKKKRGK